MIERPVTSTGPQLLQQRDRPTTSPGTSTSSSELKHGRDQQFATIGA